MFVQSAQEMNAVIFRWSRSCSDAVFEQHTLDIVKPYIWAQFFKANDIVS